MQKLLTTLALWAPAPLLAFLWVSLTAKTLVCSVLCFILLEWLDAMAGYLLDRSFQENLGLENGRRKAMIWRFLANTVGRSCILLFVCTQVNHFTHWVA